MKSRTYRVSSLRSLPPAGISMMAPLAGPFAFFADAISQPGISYPSIDGTLTSLKANSCDLRRLPQASPQYFAVSGLQTEKSFVAPRQLGKSNWFVANQTPAPPETTTAATAPA